MGPFHYSDFKVMPVLAEEETAATPCEATHASISQPHLPPVMGQQNSDDVAMLQRKKLKLEIEVLELKKQWYQKKLKLH